MADFDFASDFTKSQLLAQGDLGDFSHLLPNAELVELIFSYYEKYAAKTSDPRPLAEVLKQVNVMLQNGYSEDAISSMAMYIPHFEDMDRLGAVFMSNVNEKVHSLCLDAWAKRQALRKSSCVEEKENAYLLDVYEDMATRRRMESRKEKKQKSPLYKRKRKYKESLERVYNFLDSNLLIPHTTAMAFNSQILDPLYLNLIYPSIRQIFAVTDGGYHDLHAYDCQFESISKDTWLQAIELTLCMFGYHDCDIIDMPDPKEDEETSDSLLEGFPFILCIGLLIHNLHLFSPQKYSEMLYQQRKHDEYPQKEKSQYEQIQELTQKNNAANKELDSLKKDNRALREQLKSKGNNTDVNRLVHDYNKQLKEKDLEIERLQELMQQLDEEVSTLAERSHIALHLTEQLHSRTLWADLKLPKDKVLFVGGNPNMTKKLRQSYPGWQYINSTNPNAPLPEDVDVIFVMTNHTLSHGLWERVNKFYSCRDQMRYVQATNLEKLVEEMKFEFWAMQKASENAT